MLKEHRVFNAAMGRMERYLDGLKYCQQPLEISHVDSGTGRGHYGDYEEVRSVINASAKKLKESAGLHSEYLWIADHMDKRKGTVVFFKCKGDQCNHCKDFPASATAETMAILRKFPSPIPSTEHPGHFLTFMEALHAQRALPSEHMPSVRDGGHGRCSENNCSYVFTSAKGKRDHRLKVHQR